MREGKRKKDEERRGKEGWKEKQYERDRWVGEVNNQDE